MSEWKEYDPSWLVEAARREHPEKAWLRASLAKCTRIAVEGGLGQTDAYYYTGKVQDKFMRRRLFWTNLQLVHTEHGHIVLDVLKDGSISGIEFVDRLVGNSRQVLSWIKEPEEREKIIVGPVEVGQEQRESA